MNTLVRPHAQAVEGGFSNALDLVKYIKANFGNEFGIAVAGYPEVRLVVVVVVV